MYPETLNKSNVGLFKGKKRSIDKTDGENATLESPAGTDDPHALSHHIFPLFKGLKENEINIINRRVVKKQFDPRQYVYFPGEGHNHIYFIASGNVEMGILDKNGRELIVDVLGRGEIFGASIGAGISTGYARTLSDTVLFTMDKVEFDEILQKYPRVAYKLLKLLTFKMNLMQQKIESLVFRGVRSRICYQLLRLYKKSGNDKTGYIGIQLTHQDLANMVGSSRETTSLHLSQLRRDGIIAYNRRQFRIVSVPQLRRQMNCDGVS
ncbi:MAG: helix-turn-helix domain-containing protein [Aliifodinibius sp.]|nr:helix-turn-helix domain-containing protein [Fodinibius sp.]